MKKTDRKTDDQVADSLLNEISDKDIDLPVKYFICRLLGDTTAQAYKRLNIPKEKAYHLNKRIKESPSIQNRAAETLNLTLSNEIYREFCQLALPRIAGIESKALAAMEKKPDLAIRNPQLLKQIKQGAGVRLDDPQVIKEDTIIIDNVQVLIQQAITSNPNAHRLKPIQDRTQDDDRD